MINGIEPDKSPNTLTKAERLYLRDEIKDLFSNGKSFITYPLRVVYLLSDTPLQGVRCRIMVAVPKKRFKRAVKRNRIKRLIRESYRKNKHSWIAYLENNNKFAKVAFTMVGENLPDYKTIENAIKKTLYKIETQTLE
ncbi:ribonuclease P protein component [Porphyromonas macacae]|uniref:ribonuclease P protein component n=1 Tax=Porphyromonas macacae TaxID=28115 RepID=UPI0009DD613C|nr:ribonuclease P protein component [Porphyromonas macacae]